MKANMVLLGLWLIVGICCMALVVASAQGQPYTAAMMTCNGEFRFAGPHMANFADENGAKAWADGQLAGSFDIAYIYRPDGPGLLSNLLWVKSESQECYGTQFRDWTRPQ